MKIRFRYSVGKWLMGKFRGKVLYPFVCFSDPQDRVPDWLFRHELEHIYQVRRDGWWKFHISYLWQLATVGYQAIQYEIDARRAANTPLTKGERELKDA